MPESKTRRGGAPTQSDVFVNCDQVTMTGNGSIDHPLVAAGGGGVPTVEHMVVEGSAEVNPDVGTTFVSYDGVIPDSPVIVNLPLAAGLIDGQPKTITVAAASNIEWQITPAPFADGDSITFTPSEGGAATFRWNSTAVAWSLVSTQGGAVQG